ncbi:MAG: histidine phosphatase family protein, partial [Nanoarchaeota archaeon]
MKLIIVRHGETFENISGICQGQSDGTLSDKGKLQAKKVAERLKDEKIDALYSSDLQRTVDTANEILRYHPKIELKKDKLLRERYFGEFEGKPFGADFDWNNLPDSVETDKQMCDRVREFLEKVYP